jgi:hypothetical protein
MDGILTAAFPSPKPLVPHSEIAPIIAAGPAKLTIALVMVLMYSFKYGWLCFMPQLVFSMPGYNGKYRGSIGGQKVYSRKDTRRQRSWVPMSYQLRHKNMRKVGGLLKPGIQGLRRGEFVMADSMSGLGS